MEDTLRGADIIDTILRSMRENAEALRYSVVVPSAYDVYLHADDFARFGELGGRIAQEAARALDEALEKANRRDSIVDNLRDRVGRARVPWERVNRAWEIRLFEDPNGEIQPGDVFVEATLVVSEPGSLGGSETRRVRTSRMGERTETREVADVRTVTATAPAVFATLAYRDDDGEAVFRMEKPSVLIGRGGPTIRSTSGCARSRTSRASTRASVTTAPTAGSTSRT